MKVNKTRQFVINLSIQIDPLSSDNGIYWVAQDVRIMLSQECIKLPWEICGVSAWYHTVNSIQGRPCQSRYIRNDLRFLVLHKKLSKQQIKANASVLVYYIIETMSVVGMLSAITA